MWQLKFLMTTCENQSYRVRSRSLVDKFSVLDIVGTILVFQNTPAAWSVKLHTPSWTASPISRMDAISPSDRREVIMLWRRPEHKLCS